MNELFNTVFETELRLLILLSINSGADMTAEKLTSMDFIALYGASFGITETNLHGDGDYKFSEVAVRRDLTQKALRELVRRGFIKVENTPAGFAYTIAETGNAFCKDLNDEYANEYREALIQIRRATEAMSERDLASFINRHSVNSLRRG